MNHTIEELAGGRFRLVVGNGDFFLQHVTRSREHAERCVPVLERSLAKFVENPATRGGQGAPMRYLSAKTGKWVDRVAETRP